MGWTDGERLRRVAHLGLSHGELALLLSAIEAAAPAGSGDPVLACRGAPLAQCEAIGRVVAGAKRMGEGADMAAWRCCKAFDELCALSLEGGWIREKGSDWADRDPAAHALYNDMPKLALLLVDRGASADAQMHDGEPLIVWFARAEAGAWLLEFLDRAPDLNARGKRGGTFLHHMSWFEGGKGERPLALCKAVVGRALARKFDLDVRDHVGSAPLHWAAQAGDRDLAQALVEGGADPLALDARGLAPWEDAGSDEAAQYLEAAALSARESGELGSIERDIERMAGHAALELARQGRLSIDGKPARSVADLLDAQARSKRARAKSQEAKAKGRL